MRPRQLHRSVPKQWEQKNLIRRRQRRLGHAAARDSSVPLTHIRPLTEHAPWAQWRRSNLAMFMCLRA